MWVPTGGYRHFQSDGQVSWAEGLAATTHCLAVLFLTKTRAIPAGSDSPSTHGGLMCSVDESCLTLCNPTDCSLPGSSIRGIFQARILERVAISYSRGSSWPKDPTCISGVSWTGRWILSHSATWEAHAGLIHSLMDPISFPRVPLACRALTSAAVTVPRKADKTLVLWSLKSGSEGTLGATLTTEPLAVSEFSLSLTCNSSCLWA